MISAGAQEEKARKINGVLKHVWRHIASQKPVRWKEVKKPPLQQRVFKEKAAEISA